MRSAVTQGTVAAKREGRRQDHDQNFRGSGGMLSREIFLIFGSSELARNASKTATHYEIY